MLKKFFENFRNPQDNLGGKFMLKSMNSGHEKLASWARSYLDIDKDDIVLDLGCGGGRNIEYFLTKARVVYGLDHSKASVDMARKINKKAIEAGRCQIIEGEINKLPFDDESLDIVTAFETIYFWKDLEGVFKEIYRVLKLGGQFLICNEASSKERKDVQRLASLIDFEVYTPEDLTKILGQLGFSFDYHLDKKKQLTLLARK